MFGTSCAGQEIPETWLSVEKLPVRADELESGLWDVRMAHNYLSSEIDSLEHGDDCFGLSDAERAYFRTRIYGAERCLAYANPCVWQSSSDGHGHGFSMSRGSRENNAAEDYAQKRLLLRSSAGKIK